MALVLIDVIGDDANSVALLLENVLLEMGATQVSVGLGGKDALVDCTVSVSASAEDIAWQRLRERWTT